jgi:hypothetical protein
MFDANVALLGRSGNEDHRLGKSGTASLEGNPSAIADDPTQTSYRVAAQACAFLAV